MAAAPSPGVSNGPGEETEERALAKRVVQSAVDLHIHPSPDIFPRWVTAVTAAEAARDAGMRAIVVKSHSTDTAARAESAREATGFPVYGGVVLNYSVGGLNHHAVVESAKQGGVIVWMPTIGARHFIASSTDATQLRSAIPRGVRGLSAVTSNGRLKASAHRILDAVAENDLILASGHLAPSETVALFTEAARRGIRRLIATHPLAPFVAMGDDDMRRVADLGAYLEFTPQRGFPERARAIRLVGAERCFIATDGGNIRRPPPVESFLEFVQGLYCEGFSESELRCMSQTVPASLLGLPDDAGAGTGNQVLASA